jgi:hypothetical protein
MKSKFSGVRTFKGAVVNRWRSPDSAGIAAVGLVAGRIQGFGQAHCQAVGKLLVIGDLTDTCLAAPRSPVRIGRDYGRDRYPCPKTCTPRKHRGRWPQIGSRRGPAVVLTMVPSSSHDDCDAPAEKELCGDENEDIKSRNCECSDSRLACVFHLSMAHSRAWRAFAPPDSRGGCYV